MALRRPVAMTVLALLAVAPIAAAGAQSTPTTDPAVTEGSVPPGGTVDCTTSAAMAPDHGPPGTVVIVSTVFLGNCDDLNSTFFSGMTCSGTYQVEGSEAVPFSMTVDPETGNATGTFTAPVTEPDPPVVDAIEPVTVSVTCQTDTPVSPGEGGGTGATTYVYPPDTFDLELFADSSEEPTFVDNDRVEDEVDVVSATPTFTG